MDLSTFYEPKIRVLNSIVLNSKPLNQIMSINRIKFKKAIDIQYRVLDAFNSLKYQSKICVFK